MKPVCEIMVQQVFPSMRAVISKELIYEYKLNQSEVANLLGVSQPAVSQYLRQLRGDNKKLLDDESVSKEIKKLCKKINDKKINKMDLMNEFCNLCKIITSKGLVCRMHNNIYRLENCSLCIKNK